MVPVAAELFDGASAAAHAVALAACSDGLEIHLADGNSHRIEYRSVSHLQKTATGFRCSVPNFRIPDGPVMMLAFGSSELFEVLDRRISEQAHPARQMAGRFWRLKWWQLLAIAALLLALFFAGFIAVLQQAYRATPLSYDIRLGKSVDAAWSKFYEPCVAPRLDTFFHIGLARLSLPSDRLPHRIVILNDSTKNAIALPGGTIYVFRGLIETSRTPDEILGVLAHELVHSEQRHTVRQIFASMGISYMISLTVGLAIDGFDMLEGLERTLELSSALFTLRYSRTFEREADSLGIMRMHNAGLRVGPLDSLLTRITPKPRTRDRIFAFFSTHPLTVERSKRFAAAREREHFSQDTVFREIRADWETIKRSCPPPKDSTPLWRKMLR